ncbi:MAG TPA: hypothetical protein VFE05_17070 [Longimicrobiaceae bacterium]|nr:hypothetical protein [Longimicrobiaceae bacterium]
MQDLSKAAGLKAALLDRISRGTGAPIGDAEFGALALAVFAHQYAGNEPYRMFCDRRGASPSTVSHWMEVPAVPTDAFKAAALVVGGAGAAARTFRTSGTTAGAERRGVHHLPDLDLYDAALRAGFAAHLLPDGARPRIVSLVPARDGMPESSLSHMIGEVMADAGGRGGWFVDPQGGIAHGGLSAALRDAERMGEPVLIPGTAFAFVHWLDALRERGESFRLPAGSRVMDTGGFKGRSREVTREELYAGFAERLGIGPAWCVNEYGMTEMSSQFYDTVAGRGGADVDPGARRYQGPPWVRTQATDPETLRPLPDGEVGVLRHWDLANLNSVMAIQTADLGITSPDGFRLLGRATGAEARGCSIAMDELLSAIRR